jgi:hypothetical protein
MRRIAAAIAAITLIAGTAHAQGHGGGGGNANKGGKSAEAGPQGGGNGNAMRGGGSGNGHSDHGNGGQSPSMASSMRASDQRGNGSASRGQGGSSERGNQAQGNAERGNGQGNARVERASSDRERGNDNRTVAVDRGRGNDNRTVVIDRGRDRNDIDIVRVRDFERLGPRGLIDGCPPGLAKKSPPCVPPGLARRGDRDDDFRRLLSLDRPDFWGMRLNDGRYFYDDGYLVQLGSDGRVGSYIPLLGGALGVGNVWPSYYEPYRLPTYYEQYYGLGPYESYRYADNVIYRVDPQTSAINSIAALLTGDNFAIGQPMPLGYDIYNVPYDYRDQYIDGPDAYYRYADGYVYQVDPETQLIAAAIQLLAS